MPCSASAARGTWETFEPIDTVRVLATYTLGGVAKFFAEIGEKAPRREVPPPMEGPPDLGALMAAAERYGMQLKVPPEA